MGFEQNIRARRFYEKHGFILTQERKNSFGADEVLYVKLLGRSIRNERIFAKPCVGAIIERIIENETYILVQTREKTDGGNTNGLLELPAGKSGNTKIFSPLSAERSGRKQD